jgi:hypothetical protein
MLAQLCVCTHGERHTRAHKLTSLSLGLIVGDEESREDGAALHLPDLDAEVLVRRVLSERVVVDKVGIVDLRVHPRALVGRVGDLFGLPRALVLGVVDLGRLPLAVELVVPVVGLGGVGIGDLRWYRVPVGRLLVVGVVDLLAVILRVMH